MKSIALTLMLIAFRVMQGSGQDPHFSQFYANRVYLNPAYTGIEAGWTMNINYRNQWFGLPDASIGRFSDSYGTYSVSLEKQVSCMYGRDDINLGVGLSVFKDDAGAQPLTTQGAGLSMSYELKLFQNTTSRVKLKRLDMRFGRKVRRWRENTMLLHDRRN